MRNKQITYIITLVFVLFSAIANAQQPLHEIRAVWLTTLSGLDWPKTRGTSEAVIAKQKKELCDILDQYQRLNINTVILQTRIRGSVIYPSAIEPWDDCFSGSAGVSPGWDPLKYAIDECHKRGLQLHAWVVCIPLGQKKAQQRYGARAVTARQPKICKTAGAYVFHNPSQPATADYIASICSEITRYYDVDGISLDYIRYPESSFAFSDGTPTAEQRKANITRIVQRVHDAVKAIKPWVRLSSSPIGKRTDLSRYSAKGWSCDAMGQDAAEWLRTGIQDQLFPMMYFQGNNYYPFVCDWQENSYGHPVAPGLGIYFLDPREGKWNINDVRAEMYATRHTGVGGIAFYRSQFLTNNVKKLYDITQTEFFGKPALQPAMHWMHQATTPDAPANLQYDENRLTWNAVPTTDSLNYILYNVYCSDHWPVDCTKGENLVAASLKDTCYYPIHNVVTPQCYYAVTASNRYAIESAPAQENHYVYTPRPDINVTRLINPKEATKKVVKKTAKKKKKK